MDVSGRRMGGDRDRMTSLIKTWGEDALTEGTPTIVSPSGHAVAFVPMDRLPFNRCIDIRFSDGRPSVVFEDSHFNGITLLGWASDDEIVYLTASDMEVYGIPAALYCYSIARASNQHILDWSGDSICASFGGDVTRLSILTEHDGRAGVYDLDIVGSQLRRRTEFDAALDQLEVYPGFGYSYSEANQEIAVVAWPRGDYRGDGPNRGGSAGKAPVAPDAVVRRNGTWVRRAERSEEALRRKPPRICILSRTGDWVDVPDSSLAKRPQWVPDGSAILYECQRTVQHIQSTGEFASVELMYRTDLSRRRLGECFLSQSIVVHPSGPAFIRVVDEAILKEVDDGASV